MDRPGYQITYTLPQYTLHPQQPSLCTLPAHSVLCIRGRLDVGYAITASQSTINLGESLILFWGKVGALIKWPLDAGNSISQHSYYPRPSFGLCLKFYPYSHR